jgi:hypothetical protein
MFWTLVHEMLRACHYLFCRPEARDLVTERRKAVRILEHGIYFQTARSIWRGSARWICAVVTPGAAME